MPRPHREFDYDVCLSFAGGDRAYVEQVADSLREKGVRVFYDAYERAGLWGKDLYEHLDDVYRNAARFCVLFASKTYAENIWTNHERKSAQARALKEHEEYVLPVRFDETPIPGLRDTVGYIDLRDTSPQELAELVVEKLGPEPRENFFPPVPDQLFEYFEIPADDEDTRDLIARQGQSFVEALQRMTEDERSAVYTVLDHGCVAELPENVHINVDLARRNSGFPKSKLYRLLGQLRSLGFYCSTRMDDDHGEDQLGGPSELIVMEWHLLLSRVGGNLTALAHAMVRLAQVGYCDYHAEEALRRVDFGQLSSATTGEDVHEDAAEDLAV
jgi:hypothetical protein